RQADAGGYKRRGLRAVGDTAAAAACAATATRATATAARAATATRATATAARATATRAAATAAAGRVHVEVSGHVADVRAGEDADGPERHWAGHDTEVVGVGAQGRRLSRWAGVRHRDARHGVAHGAANRAGKRQYGGRGGRGVRQGQSDGER